MASVRIDPELLSLPQDFIRHTFEAFNGGVTGLVREVRSNAPVFEGDLREGFEGSGAQLVGGEIQASLINAQEGALYGVRGRGPGKFPPYGANTNLARWARTKGIPAYLVARKIAQEGSDRWQANENVLDIDRRSRPGQEMPKPDGILLRTADTIAVNINNFSL